ncbi:MAG: hypothetical protein DRP42_06675 [Tenericutes bacterium]|nr:MAG: hypothetical protein DRP42_06675 [Mycoplasmatota bacterium]
MNTEQFIPGVGYVSGDTDTFIPGMGYNYIQAGAPPVPDPDALVNGIALGATEYTFESFVLGDTPVETMFLGDTNITQQYVTDDSDAYLYDENEDYITYGD